MRMFAFHAQIMCNNSKSAPVVMAQTDLVARLSGSLYGGAKIIYDDKAKALDMQKYGIFWKAKKNFLIGFEYNQTGDKQSVDASFNHKLNMSTSVGSTVSYDLSQSKITTRIALEKKLDDTTTAKVRVDNVGQFDLSLTGLVTPQLTATFSTGGSLTSVING